MFRKIICLIMVVFTLLSSFVISASAATDDSNVLEDLSTSSVDGVSFSEANYPVDYDDRNLYVIATVEQGFRSASNSPNFAFYVYVYNPSCLEVTDRTANAMQAGYNEEHRNEQYSYYGLKLLGKTDDDRFLKFKAVDSSTYKNIKYLYSWQESAVTRVYDIASIRLIVNGVLETFPVNKAFYFSGNDFDNSLTCYSQELGAIQIEVHPTNWISPNAGYKTDGTTQATMYDHYEINSVYFTMPRSLFEGPDAYDYIEYIGAKFNAYRTTPIVVTAPKYFKSDKGQATKNAIIDGITIPEDGDIDVFDLCAYYENWMWGLHTLVSWCYTENGSLRSKVSGTETRVVDCLAYYFENPNLDEYDFSQAKTTAVGFTSEEFEAYFLERFNNPNYDNSKLYTEHKPVERNFSSLKYKEDALYKMSTYSSVDRKDKEWYEKLSIREDSYAYDDFKLEAEELLVIQNPSEYMTVTDPEGVANELFISQHDVEHFSGICEKAVANNEVVVLLRFGFSDYNCAPISDVWEAVPIYNGIIGVAIEKWVYFDFNTTHISFSKNKQSIVLPLVSNTVNAPGDGVVFPDTNKDFWTGVKDAADPDDDWVRKIIMIIAIVFLFFVLLFLLKFFFELFEKKQKIHIAYGPPPEKKKRKKKWFRR